MKEELAAAKLVRRNRQEYSVLAKVIKERPSRVETTRRLKELQDQLDADLERQRVLEQKVAPPSLISMNYESIRASQRSQLAFFSSRSAGRTSTRLLFSSTISTNNLQRMVCPTLPSI